MAAALSPTPLLLPATFRPRRPLAVSLRAAAAPGDAKSVGSQAEGTEGKAKAAEAEKARLLTAEKARLLRRQMRAMQNWHDPMYHSAIATRLASPDEK